MVTLSALTQIMPVTSTFSMTAPAWLTVIEPLGRSRSGRVGPVLSGPGRAPTWGASRVVAEATLLKAESPAALNAVTRNWYAVDGARPPLLYDVVPPGTDAAGSQVAPPSALRSILNPDSSELLSAHA